MKNHPLFINITNKCNFDCTYCFNKLNRGNINSGFMEQNWKGLIYQFQENSIREIRISGGEPFIVSYLEDFCKCLCQSNIAYTITSNGSLLRQNKHWLTEYPPSTLWVSFHRQYHTLQLYTEILQEVPATVNQLGMNIFYDDLADIPDLLHITNKLNIKRIKILFKTTMGRNNRSTTHSVSRLDHLFELLIKIKEKKKVEIRVELPLFDNSIGVKSCLLLSRSLFTISEDGKVFDCCISTCDRDRYIGDLKIDSLNSIISKWKINAQIKVPCFNLLRGIEKNRISCPLNLIEL